MSQDNNISPFFIDSWVDKAGMKLTVGRHYTINNLFTYKVYTAPRFVVCARTSRYLKYIVMISHFGRAKLLCKVETLLNLCRKRIQLEFILYTKSTCVSPVIFYYFTSMDTYIFKVNNVFLGLSVP